MFRNDAPARNPSNIQLYEGTVVYSCLDYYSGYPYCANTNGIEITVLRFIVIAHISIISHISINTTVMHCTSEYFRFTSNRSQSFNW